jgi:hypothetical protein
LLYINSSYSAADVHDLSQNALRPSRITIFNETSIICNSGVT